MSIYLSIDQIEDLIKHRNNIFLEHAQAFQKYSIDILSNDILSSLSMWEIIREYDKNYEPNFHRNAEDGKSGTILIERKCASVRPSKKGGVGKSSWLFHAQETIKSTRYVFAVRRKDNLQIVRIYDIKSKPAIAKIEDCLADQRQRWIQKGKPPYDGITVPEKLLLTIAPKKQFNVKNCIVTFL